jgi:hypothetical protein
MDEVLDDIEHRNEQLYDDYIRERSVEDLVRDIERDIVPVQPIALALIRQREHDRAKAKAIVHQVLLLADGLEQLVAMFTELPIVVPVATAPRIRFAGDDGDHPLDNDRQEASA